MYYRSQLLILLASDNRNAERVEFWNTRHRSSDIKLATTDSYHEPAYRMLALLATNGSCVSPVLSVRKNRLELWGVPGKDSMKIALYASLEPPEDPPALTRVHMPENVSGDATLSLSAPIVQLLDGASTEAGWEQDGQDMKLVFKNLDLIRRLARKRRDALGSRFASRDKAYLQAVITIVNNASAADMVAFTSGVGCLDNLDEQTTSTD